MFSHDDQEDNELERLASLMVSDPLVQMMSKYKMPLSQSSYLALSYPDGDFASIEDIEDAEQLSGLPEFLPFLPVCDEDNETPILSLYLQIRKSL